MSQQPQQTTPQSSNSDWTTVLLLSIFLGGVGGHRFYTGHTGIGILMLLTAGGCGFLAIYDLIMVATEQFEDAQGRIVKKE
jgi:TM2 domain-containing membrane protein YozV